MAKYARGKKSQAISDRSGLRVPYTQLKTTWDGLRVAPEDWEPKNPQLTPAKNVVDATALFNPRPDNDPENVEIFIGFNYDPFIDPRKKPGVGVDGTAFVGFPTLSLDTNFSATGVSGAGSVGSASPASDLTASGVSGTGGVAVDPAQVVTLAVTVQNVGGANKYFIAGVQQDTLELMESRTYYFDQSDSSNSGHPLRFSSTPNGTHGGGSEYTTGVTTSGTPGNAGAYTQIVVANSAPTLYYYCTQHSAMGGQANTPVFASVVVELSDSVTGASGTGAVGNEAIQLSIAEVGVAGTGGVGVEIPVVEVTGVGGSGGAGSVGVEALEVSINEVGVGGTGAIGSPTYIADLQVGVSGVSSTGGVGTITEEGTEESVGVSGTGGVGNEAIQLSIAEVGVSGTGGVGNESIQAGATVTETGVNGTGGVGNEALELSITETGVSGTGGVGNESIDILGWGNAGWGEDGWGE